ncbi:hypothetical protein YC2023_018174 [Brassica napus]|uniref:(rape) hypothetical protein n=1 Tax=Brassica napus TaxID=3708 RepID=A0A816KNN6_BRANA|nr:unnamed protein product [Brassica napus]
MMTYNTPMSLLSLTEDVTRTFVPGEQLRVNIERDRRLEEGTASQVLVGCRIISPKSLFPPKNWWRSWSSTDPARRKGTCDDVQLGSWNTRRTKCHFMSSTILACVKKTSYP